MELFLDGLRVWITRPGPGAERSAALFRDRGATCLVESTVTLRPRRLDPRERGRLAAFLDDARLLLTSANAARFLLDAVDDADLRRALRACPASAVGEATARAAEGAGLRVDHVASTALGASLAAELVADGVVTRVLLPGSDKRRPEAEDLLREAGVEVLPLVCYHTVPVEDLSAEAASRLRRAELDAVALYSPSAVEGLTRGAAAAGLAPEALPPALCLGPTTSAAVAAAGLRVAVEADPPGEAALIDATSRWWSRR